MSQIEMDLPALAQTASGFNFGSRRMAQAVACTTGLVLGDLVGFVASLQLAYAVDQIIAEPSSAGLKSLAFVNLHSPILPLGLGILLYGNSRGRYTRRSAAWYDLREIVFLSAMAAALSCLASSMLKDAFPLLALLLTWIFLPVTTSASRLLAISLLRLGGLWQRRGVLLGHLVNLDDMQLAMLAEPSFAYHLVAEHDPAAVPERAEAAYVDALLTRHDAAFLMLDTNIDNKFAERLNRAGVRFSWAPSKAHHGTQRGRSVAAIGRDFASFNGRDAGSPLSCGIKRTIDIVFAALLLVAISPVMAIIALIVKADGGPAIFGHARVGAGGCTFLCLKFRTMVVDSDKVLRELLETDPEACAEWAATQKLRHDPRITRIGRILRISSLDELPQIFNILRGEMSVVGPRPIVQQEVARYADHIADYYGTRPGLTGLWQVSGRSETTYERRVALDSWYVRNWVIWKDIIIIFRTIMVVLGRQGAR